MNRLLTLFLLSTLFIVGCSQVDAGFVAEPPQFRDVADEVGLTFTQSAFRWGTSGDPVAMMGGGVCWLDYDGDGWQDLYVVNSYAELEAGRWQTEEGGLPTSALFRNVEGQFTDVSAESGTGLAMRGNGCISADFNNDNHPDLYITTARFNVLLWNNGDGTFEDGGEAAGIDWYGWQTAASAGDLNGDGWLDLFVAGYVDVNNAIENSTMGFPNTKYGLRDLLFISNGLDENGYATFREVGEAVGLESAEFEYGLGAVLSDMDGDRDLDLFIANDTNPNRLYANEPLENDPEGIGFRFVEVGEGPAVRDINSGMGVAGADYDNNGAPDLFISNMGPQTHSVYRNLADVNTPQYANVTDEIGVEAFGVDWTGWGTAWADFDLDSDLDLFVAHGAIPVVDLDADRQTSHLYQNLTAQGEIGRFKNATTDANLGNLGPYLARGSAVADYDNDGDLDIAINSIGGALALLHNDVAGGNWLMVELEDPAIGAVVTAVLADGTELRREILAGSSYLSADEQRSHFGLGGNRYVKEVRVQWLDGSERVKRNVKVNQVLEVERP
ncbi:MAG: CRTAC1 family protein [Candidatus Promineifilaceae bacterium]